MKANIYLENKYILTVANISEPPLVYIEFIKKTKTYIVHTKASVESKV